MTSSSKLHELQESIKNFKWGSSSAEQKKKSVVTVENPLHGRKISNVIKNRQASSFEELPSPSISLNISTKTHSSPDYPISPTNPSTLTENTSIISDKSLEDPNDSSNSQEINDNSNDFSNESEKASTNTTTTTTTNNNVQQMKISGNGSIIESGIVAENETQKKSSEKTRDDSKNESLLGQNISSGEEQPSQSTRYEPSIELDDSEGILQDEERMEIDELRKKFNDPDNTLRTSDMERLLFQFLQSTIEKQRLLPVLSAIIKSELRRNKIGILREESLGANLLKLYWFHFEGSEYLRKIVKPLVKGVVSEAKSKPLEIDPNRVEDPNIAKKNVEKVLNLTKKFMNVFFHSYDLFPPKFETILRTFYNLLTEVESTKSHLGLGYSENALRLFGGFLMLRFICPAIVSPQKCGLVKENSVHVQRALVLISKILQSIANQVELQGAKEAYMTTTNQFVLDQMPHMMAFLHNLMDEERLNRQKNESKQRSPLGKERKRK